MIGAVVLGSLGLGGIERLVGGGEPVRAMLVTTAANGLDDREAIVRSCREPLTERGWDLVELDLERSDGHELTSTLAGAGAVVVSGGDPYRLLAAMRRSGFDRSIGLALARGVSYVGVSAGAAVAGPNLRPLLDVNPFPAPANQPLDGLGLSDTLVLSHDERTGRRERHAAAQREHGLEMRLIALRDDELLLSGHPWRLLNATEGVTIRPAEVADAAAIAGSYAESARAAWHHMFTDAQLADLNPPVEAWGKRLATLDDADDLVVVEDHSGVAGFVWCRPSEDLDLDTGHGEIAAFYTRPRLWGRGTGLRLATYALDRLRAAGHHTAVLWTEERNERPLRIYHEMGWRPDGAVREREYLGTKIRELRHRMVL
ncbi:MAG: GNAT family N-acetyltransferase [Actinomycetota bacterium]|nr:GNAT family N-acetyltransferase [Actinomycetota bacterium]